MSERRATVAGGVLGVALASCGAGGAKTTCGAFQGMLVSSQQKVVTNALKSFGQSTGLAEVDEALFSAKAYRAVNSSGAKVGGIFGDGQ